MEKIPALLQMEERQESLLRRVPNPMHNRDCCGAVASLSSVSTLPFVDAQDGISNTFSIVPDALGRGKEGAEAEQVQAENLVRLLDGYMEKGGHH